MSLVFTLFKICIIISLPYRITKVYIPSRIFHHTDMGFMDPTSWLYLNISGSGEKCCLGWAVNAKTRGINGTLEYLLREDWEWLVFNTFLEVIQNCYFKKYCLVLALLFKICFIGLFFLFHQLSKKIIYTNSSKLLKFYFSLWDSFWKLFCFNFSMP